jgi:hypothetical protein
MRPSLIAEILDREFSSSDKLAPTPVMIWGPPGVGKSQIVAAIATKHDSLLIDVRLSQMEPTDLRGIPFRVGDRVEWSTPALLPDVARHGPRGILFLDEITSAPPTVTAAAYQLILDRRLGDYRVPDGWVIFAAGNRQGDRGVTYQMPAPLANRFTHYEVEVNLDDWIAWAFGVGVDERIIGFLRFRPELLFQFDPARPVMAFPSPRSWEYAHRALQKFGDNRALLGEAIQGAVGAVAAAGFSAFMNSAEKLPDIDAILNGEAVRAPEQVDLQYAVCSALVSRVKASGADLEVKRYCANILRYAKTFPQREMAIMLITDLQRSLDAPLITLPEFAEWAEAVTDVMLQTAY